MLVELESSQTQVQRILQSKAFRTSEAQRNLLTYLAGKSLEGSSAEIKEYSVGLDVFGKPSSFDPRQESVVRMHMARLRQKLADYYRGEGAGDEIVVDVPKGAFRVTFEPRSRSGEAHPADIDPEPRASRRREAAMAIALIAAVLSALFLGVRLIRLEDRPAPPAGRETVDWTPELRQLWSPILDSGRPLMICLATPQPSPGVQPSFGFAAIGAASGAFLLGQFLSHRVENVLVTRSDQLSVPELTMDNIVFVGPTAGTRPMEAVTAGQRIVLEPGGIRNLDPQPGEPAFVPERPPTAASNFEDSYALINHLPGLYGNGDVVNLSGDRISSVLAGVQAFTNPAVARAVVSKMKTAGSGLPRYYQVVLKVRSMDDMPVEITYMFHRDLSSSGPKR